MACMEFRTLKANDRLPYSIIQMKERQRKVQLCCYTKDAHAWWSSRRNELKRGAIIGDRLYCTVSIYNQQTGEWVGKSDVGTEATQKKKRASIW